jgi:hypothetical protein
MNKPVSLNEAIASGRRFRAAHAPIGPNSHRVQTGHFWRSGNSTGLIRGPNGEPILTCLHCGLSLYVRKASPDLWMIEKTDDELEQESREILRSLVVPLRMEQSI